MKRGNKKLSNRVDKGVGKRVVMRSVLETDENEFGGFKKKMAKKTLKKEVLKVASKNLKKVVRPVKKKIVLPSKKIAVKRKIVARTGSGLNEYISKQLSQMDYLMKRKQYSDAKDVFSIMYSEMEDSDLDIHGWAILRRLWRMKKDTTGKGGAMEEMAVFADDQIVKIKERLNSVRGKKAPELVTKSLALASIAGFLGALFFFSPNFAGNVVSSGDLRTSNIIGVIFLMLGILGASFYFWKKRR